jgi:hypothetical protein
MIYIYYILTVNMLHGSITHGYHFVEKANCEKVGKNYAKVVKSTYSCKKVRK